MKHTPYGHGHRGIHYDKKESVDLNFPNNTYLYVYYKWLFSKYFVSIVLQG
jgi:hypothetical protein